MDILGKGFADQNTKIKGIRRADKFAKMAVAACQESCNLLDFSKEKSEISIILATQFGPHSTTFKFLDNILDYSDTSASPTIFSHSVHNAATSYIASCLGICGQALTITSFSDPLKQALIMADAWLELKQTEKVIVCYVEEESDPMVFAHGYCDFPSYSKNKILSGAVSILLQQGNLFKIPERILNPFKYIKEL
jgi:3-oxoacyl-(acyl-carrier-protein) synthase